MKRVILILGAGWFIFGLIGWASLWQIIKAAPRVDSPGWAQVLPPYSGPKSRIAVANFEIKAAKVTGEIGLGLREMFISALVNSNRFSVVEYQVLETADKEQELPVSGVADLELKTETDKNKTADLIIMAAITEFELQASGGRAGVGGGGGVSSGPLGGLAGGALNKARLALDIRLLDTSTSKIFVDTCVQGQSSDISGAMMAGFLGDWDLGSGLSAYANTSMEKAIRICIIEAVKYIVGGIPTSYYKH
nr:hypothetical protein [Candidatus Aminicenantes bacterium]